MSITNRWGLAAAGFLMQMALGAVYAWSVFRVPLSKQFHWSISQVTLTFTICIFVLGVSAFSSAVSGSIRKDLAWSR
jgi:MFS transporter, OFA family, oxalate/formate antiporter